MQEIEIIRRYNVSPAFLSEAREKFLPLEYLEPRQYKNACRYKNLRRIEDKKENKIYDETWIQKIIDKSEADKYVTVNITTQNRLDLLAYNFYNTPNFWWVIALANNIIDPFDVPEGTLLRIPPTISMYNNGGVLE